MNEEAKNNDRNEDVFPIWNLEPYEQNNSKNNNDIGYAVCSTGVGRYSVGY